ncbi:hypothetical protein DRF60_18300 [Chryseobacterium elymi]|uniref:Uncharacterized protein n=1 Tax=Chryseobacterium elymi TaxID=395936 RepID=A0A3D9D7Q5_9FLAO|nr:hypothetical protein [Chryseobacterium elymi]REC74029.1 hypothetical protein DRF60_18300 [Chryseobacterium elymi]
METSYYHYSNSKLDSITNNTHTAKQVFTYDDQNKLVKRVSYGRYEENKDEIDKSKPIYGAAAVIDWGDNEAATANGSSVGGDGHITFVIGKSEDGKHYYCLGGNQGGVKGARTVKISKYSESDIDWFVIPPNYTPTEDEYNLKVMTSEADVDSQSNTRSN